MTNSQKTKDIFLPGGPWISGQYLDEYLKEEKLNIHRFIYKNHESRHVQNQKTTFLEICNDTLEYLNSIQEPYNLIGHSFGGLIMLHLIGHPLLTKKIKKFIIISTPLTSQRSTVFQERTKELGRLDYFDNNSFQEVFNKILPLYFYKDSSQRKHLFTDTFYEGNQAANLTDDQFSVVKQNFKTYENQLTIIYGDEDLLLTEDEMIPPDNKEIFRFENCGHFPMLEVRENFTRVLERVLD